MSDTAGIGDPYWYEWTVGLLYIIDMLDDSSGINAVTLQKSCITGWDDVVVERNVGPDEYIQVKHSRVGDTISFGDLVSTKTSKSGVKSESLLHVLSQSYKDVSPGKAWRAILFTNRKAGERSARTQSGVVRPALLEFWSWISGELTAGKQIGAFEVPEDWRNSWVEWTSQIVGDEAEKLAFLKALAIQSDEGQLDELEDECKGKLSRIFGIQVERTNGLFAALDHGLRTWTTTRRQSERVTREDVYKVLVNRKAPTRGAYVVETPQPFFPSREDFARELEKTLTSQTLDSRVFFVSGEPGSGKSSLISFLAWRSQPVIDLRYFAFRPISPDQPFLDPDADDAASSEMLWSGLLEQLAGLLAGRLAELTVPVVHEYMAADELRSHVLRLAEFIGKERGRDVVIAIDGLDHAARAKRRGLKSLMDSLIPPDLVTDGVRFLIGGQPGEGFPEYPVWLASESVTQIRIPPLERRDVEFLLKNAEPAISINLEAAVDVIHDIACGNTLATVFASAEAIASTSAEELQSVLEKRTLASGVESYYSHIWEHAIQTNSQLTQELAAGTLALAPSHVSGEMLTKVFSKLSLSSLDWKALLRRLKPLVVEEDSGFMVVHNDVRLFLERKIGRQLDWEVEIASSMADYYLCQEAPPSETHSSLFRLLELSKRKDEMPWVFGPDWVSTAAALARPLRLVGNELDESLDAAIASEDWEALVHALAGAHTFERWEGCEDNNPRMIETEERPPIGFLPSETRVRPVEAWTVLIIQEMLRDVRTLLDANRPERALSTINAWIGGMTIREVVLSCSDAFKTDIVSEGGREMTHGLIAMLKLWGEVAALLQIFPPHDSFEGLSRPYHPLFCEAALLAAAIKPQVWETTIDALDCLSPDVLFHPLCQLHEADELHRIVYALEYLEERVVEVAPGELVIGAAYWLTIAAKPKLANPWIERVLKKGLTLIGNSYNQDGAWLTCLAAYVTCLRNPQTDLNTLLGKLGEPGFTLRDQIPTIRKLMFTAGLAGQIRGLVGICPEDASKLVRKGDVKQAVLSICKRPSLKEFPAGYYKVVDDVLTLLADAVSSLSTEHQEILMKEVRVLASDFPSHDASSALWRIMEDHGEYEILESWAKHWLPTAHLGSLQYQDRQTVAGMFECLTSRRFPELCEQFREAARFSRIGYKIDDEFSLELPLLGLKSLLHQRPELWDSLGCDLLSLSRAISRRNVDNEASRSIERYVAAAAARCGANPFLSLLLSNNEDSKWFEVVSQTIRTSLATAVNQTEELTLSVAWSWWCLSVAVSRWFDESDQNELAVLREELFTRVGAHAPVLAEMAQRTTPADWSANLPVKSDSGADSLPELAELDITEAISELELRGSDANLARGVAATARRLLSEKPSSFEELLVRLIRASKVMEYERVWRWSSKDIAVDALVPLMSERQLWDLARRIRQQADPSFKRNITIANLTDLTEAVAQCRPSLLERYVRVLLDMHHTWYTGCGHLLAPPAIELEENDTQDWGEAVRDLLLLLLQSESSETVAAAIRGTFAFLEEVPEPMNEFWSKASPAARRWLLLLFETLKAERIANISDVLVSDFYSLSLDDRLQCSIVLEKSGVEPPPLMKERKTERSQIYTLPEALPDFPTVKQGNKSYSVGFSMEHSRLQRIRHLRQFSHSDAVFIEDCMARKAKRAEVPQSERKRLGRRGDKYWPNIDPSRLFFDCLEECCALGLNASVYELSAVVGYSDEPLLLRQSPIRREDLPWPETRHQPMSKLVYRNLALQLLLDAEVADGWQVVGGVVRSYDSENDYELRYWLGEGDVSSPPKVPSGRLALLEMGEVYQLQQSRGMKTLVRFPGGLYRFSDAALNVMPDEMWISSFGWQPSNGFPTVWGYQGEVVARFEHFVGPIRSEHWGPHHRQPSLQRWVVKTAALEKHGAKWSPCLHVSLEKFWQQ